jgi:hypothetical protein
MAKDEVRKDIRRINERYSIVADKSILIRHKSKSAACRLHVYDIISFIFSLRLLSQNVWGGFLLRSAPQTGRRADPLVREGDQVRLLQI